MNSSLARVFLLLGLVAFVLIVFRLWKAKEPFPYFGINLAGFPLAEHDTRSLLRGLDLVPDFIGYFHQWPAEPGGHLASETMQTLLAIAAQGAIPVITWEPMLVANDEKSFVMASEVLAGKWDLYLADFARTIAGFRQPVIIRFAHEMNLVRYHWGTTVESYPNSPLLYRQFFTYVRSAVLANGARQTYWMFCPNNQPLTRENPPEQAAWNTMAAWFPGKENVDILGVDGYGWGTNSSSVAHGIGNNAQAPWHIFASSLTELQKLAPGLPIFIGETSCASTGGERGLWIHQLMYFLRQRHVQGLMWFHVDKELDWRLTAEEARQISSIKKTKKQITAAQWLVNLRNAGNSLN